MAQRTLRDASGIFGGLTGGAAKALKNRQAQLDAAIGSATGAKPAVKAPMKKKRRTNSPYGGMYE